MTDQTSISIVLGGDFCPVGRPQEGFISGALTAETIVGSLRSVFCGSDIGIINLECPLTERGVPIPKTGANYRANPETVKLLRHLGVSAVALANNHICDFGRDGVMDTLEQCKNNGIMTVGAGVTLTSARQPLYISTKGRVVAFLNAAEQEFSIAEPEGAGANPLSLINILRDLKQARSKADHVIMIIHGGLELTHVPSPESVRKLRFLAEQGVTAVVRHHSHYIQGYEVWNGVPIFYGLGNLLFDLDTRMDPGWYQGLVIRLTISLEKKCGFELFPICQCDETPSVSLLEAGRKTQSTRDTDKYSALLADEAALSLAWDEEIKAMKEVYFSKLLIPSQTLRRIIRRLGLMRFVHPGPVASRYWLNLLRCESHRDALADILRRETRDP